MKMLSNLDLNKNEIQNVRVQNLATAPSNPVVGQIYFNTTDKTGYIYDGTSWRDIAQIVDLSAKQDTLVSGENIKTINGVSVLGSGNIEISSGGTYTGGEGITISSSGEISVINPLPSNLRLYLYDLGTKTKTQIENDDVFKELCYQISNSPWDTILYLYTAAYRETDSSVKNIIGLYHKTAHTTSDSGQITTTLTQINNSITVDNISTDKVELSGCNLSTIKIVESDAEPTSEVTINVGNDILYDVPTYDKLSHYVPISVIGSAGGVASLDSNGKVPSSQLPSYVDDVIEGYYYNGNFYTDSAHTQLITPETGKIYVDLDTNKTYRWGGTTYVEISQSTIHKFVGTFTVTKLEGTTGSVSIEHSLGSVDIVVNIYSTVTGDKVIMDIHLEDENNITINYVNADIGNYKVVIVA